MKKIIYLSLFCALSGLSSCGLFEIDNYDAPKETIRGIVVDTEGNPVYTEQNASGIPVRMTELSWKGGSVSHNPDFFCKQDGTFQNTKIFEGTYKVELFAGPFVPLTRVNSVTGETIADGSQTVKIKGTKNVTFEVQPFLKVEITDEPSVSNGKITAKVRVTRAISPADFKTLIEPMGGYSDSYINVKDVRLLVSYQTSLDSDGTDYRDTRYSSSVAYNGSSFEPYLGQKISMESLGAIPSGRTVFIRAAARIDYGTGDGTKRYNFSEVKEVFIP